MTFVFLIIKKKVLAKYDTVKSGAIECDMI